VFADIHLWTSLSPKKSRKKRDLIYVKPKIAHNINRNLQKIASLVSNVAVQINEDNLTKSSLCHIHLPTLNNKGK